MSCIRKSERFSVTSSAWQLINNNTRKTFLSCPEPTGQFRHLLLLHLALISALWNILGSFFSPPVGCFCAGCDDTAGWEGCWKLWEAPMSALRGCFHWMQFIWGAARAGGSSEFLFSTSLWCLSVSLNLTLHSSLMAGLKTGTA